MVRFQQWHRHCIPMLVKLRSVAVIIITQWPWPHLEWHILMLMRPLQLHFYHTIWLELDHILVSIHKHQVSRIFNHSHIFSKHFIVSFLLEKSFKHEMSTCFYFREEYSSAIRKILWNYFNSKISPTKKNSLNKHLLEFHTILSKKILKIANNLVIFSVHMFRKIVQNFHTSYYFEIDFQYYDVKFTMKKFFFFFLLACYLDDDWWVF